MGKYDTWTLKELRTELANRHARLSGRKMDLITRLESYDRNHNFGNEISTNEKYEMMLPDPKLYRDVTGKASISTVSSTAVDVYLETLGGSLSGGQKLYESNFLLSVRTVQSAADFFVKAQCRAEMKKSVLYNLDVKLTSSGEIEEAQCECAAGMGPEAHCKHVCTLLCGLVELSTKGTINTEESCTSKLQSFHKPKKPHQGSPVKAKKLHLGKRVNSNSTMFDPRPSKFIKMENYNSYVRMLTLNSTFHPKIPLTQTYKPANPHAIDNDHDYLAKVGSDMFLDTICTTTISAEEIAEIELQTRKQSKSVRWREERLKRMTASNFGRICKIGSRANKEKFARSLIVPARPLKNRAIKHGKIHEPMALKLYQEEAKVVVKEAGLHVMKDHPYLGASPDGLVGEDKLVEVKCPYVVKDKYISPTSIKYLKEKDGVMTLEKSHDYYYQIQGQLMITGRDSCDFVIFTNKELKIINIKNDKIFQNQMLQNLCQFFKDYFKPAYLDINYFRSYYDYKF